MKIITSLLIILICFALKTNGNTKGLERQLEEAYNILNKGNIQEALCKFQQIVENCPDSSYQIFEKAFLNIAFCYTELKDYKKAWEKYQEFYRRFPNTKIMDHYLSALSYYYYKTKNYDRSIELSQRLIREFPKSELVNNAFLGIGNCYYIKKEYRKALDMYKRVSQGSLTPEWSAWVQCSIGICYYYQNRFSEAIEEFQKFLDKYPDDKKYTPEVMFRIASSFQEKGLYHQAIEKYQEILKDHPKYEYTYNTLYQLWWCYHYKEDYDSAIATFQWFIKTYPESHLLNRAHNLMAISYSKKAKFGKNPIEAIVNFIKAILEVIKSRGYSLGYTSSLIFGDFLSSRLWKMSVRLAEIAVSLMCIFYFVTYKKTEERFRLLRSIGLLLLVSVCPFSMLRDKYGIKSLIGFSAQCIVIGLILSALAIYFYYAPKYRHKEKIEKVEKYG